MCRFLYGMLVVLGLSITFPALSDGIIIPYPSDPSVPVRWLAIVYHRVRVEIKDGFAVTTVDQAFRNDTAYPVEGEYIFPLPPGAVIKEFKLWVGGEPVRGEVLPADEARRIYLDYLKRNRDPALLEYVGRDAFRARVFPIRPEETRRIQLQYMELLPREAGVWRYRYPLNTERFSFTPLEEVEIDVRVETSAPLGGIYSPSHRATVTRDGPQLARVHYLERGVLPDRDFILYYASGTPGTAQAAILFHREEGKDGFFLLMVTPPYGDYTPIPKDLILVLDRSGSMEGEKIAQAKEAARYILEHLGPEDRFGIVSFNDVVSPLTEGLQRVTAERIKTAVAAVSELSADGGTNIQDALLMALEWLERRKQPAYVIFITDGLPTAGVTDPEEIVATCTEANLAGARIFPFGVGYDVNVYLLDELARRNCGEPTYVEPGESLERSLTSFYRKIAAPALTDLSIAVDGVEIYEVYPRPLPDLFFGSQILLLGRYRGPGNAVLHLSGNRGGDEISIECTFAFPSREEGNAFIPVLWASRRIGYLLDLIRREGETEEWVQEIIELGTRYGIATPYTSFLVAEGEAVQPPVPLFRQPGSATGVQAVQASKAIQSLKEVERPVERPGLREVEGRVFVFEEGAWVETTYSDQDTIKIAYLSDAYLELLSLAPELGPLLALGDHVIFRWHGLWIEIAPEGVHELPVEVKRVLTE